MRLRLHVRLLWMLHSLILVAFTFHPAAHADEFICPEPSRAGSQAPKLGAQAMIRLYERALNAVRTGNDIEKIYETVPIVNDGASKALKDSYLSSMFCNMLEHDSKINSVQKFDYYQKFSNILWNAPINSKTGHGCREEYLGAVCSKCLVVSPTIKQQIAHAIEDVRKQSKGIENFLQMEDGMLSLAIREHMLVSGVAVECFNKWGYYVYVEKLLEKEMPDSSYCFLVFRIADPYYLSNQNRTNVDYAHFMCENEEYEN